MNEEKQFSYEVRKRFIIKEYLERQTRPLLYYAAFPV